MLPVRMTRRSLGWPNGLDLIEGLHRDFDSLLGRVFTQGEALPYAVDVREDENHFYVEAEMPGLTKDDIEVTLENGVLTISGEKKTSVDEQKENFHLRERRYGRFTRAFTLPSAVDESKVNAVLKDGILTVTLDKREEVKPRKIAVAAK